MTQGPIEYFTRERLQVWQALQPLMHVRTRPHMNLISDFFAKMQVVISLQLFNEEHPQHDCSSMILRTLDPISVGLIRTVWFEIQDVHHERLGSSSDPYPFTNSGLSRRSPISPFDLTGGRFVEYGKDIECLKWLGKHSRFHASTTSVASRPRKLN